MVLIIRKTMTFSFLDFLVYGYGKMILRNKELIKYFISVLENNVCIYLKNKNKIC